MSSPYHAKKDLRKKLLAKRAEYSKEQIDEISRVIFEKIKQMETFRNAKTVMMYVTYGTELNTVDFLQYCIAEGKQVVTPICQADHTMILAKTETYPEGFVKTKMGIMEIPKEDAVAVDPSELDVIITPGLAFTMKGHRLGYGGGYYDRLFKIMPQKTVTLCPAVDEFILPYIPTGHYDKKIDVVVSEKRTVFVRRNVK